MCGLIAYDLLVYQAFKSTFFQKVLSHFLQLKLYVVASIGCRLQKLQMKAWLSIVLYLSVFQRLCWAQRSWVQLASYLRYFFRTLLACHLQISWHLHLWTTSDGGKFLRLSLGHKMALLHRLCFWQLDWYLSKQDFRFHQELLSLRSRPGYCLRQLYWSQLVLADEVQEPFVRQHS